MIRYSQIENLPSDHPMVVQFMKEDQELKDAYVSLPDGSFDPAEDNPEDYAGDRR